LECSIVVSCVIDMFRVAALHQFIVQRLPAGIYGSDDDIDPSSRGFKIMSREDLHALIDVAYAEVSVTVWLCNNMFMCNSMVKTAHILLSVLCCCWFDVRRDTSL